MQLSIEVDYGVIADAYGSEDTLYIWDAEIGKPPPLEE